jgi:hypothetical protein
MGYLGARGTMIYEKNLKSKISCQTPFFPTTAGDGKIANLFYSVCLLVLLAYTILGCRQLCRRHFPVSNPQETIAKTSMQETLLHNVL